MASSNESLLSASCLSHTIMDTVAVPFHLTDFYWKNILVQEECLLSSFKDFTWVAL